MSLRCWTKAQLTLGKILPQRLVFIH
ncbi:hypothetical protein GMOD_00006043 [Pyrenophora seminiperda CCB06]|uniref:Uncharacterized protein n=1 Tax=Pyrenophora seminiperda CCB06 TaxID=1302712 RepID=A0A3M7M4A5_9PLEO|nr:hypothetical protein GMOD_00006043 [Pyrenophora seminiperda CCB06]